MPSRYIDGSSSKGGAGVMDTQAILSGNAPQAMEMSNALG